MEMTWELLSKFAANTHSYAGEDGMIEELIKRLGKDIPVHDDCWAVEFGADDGIECSNTANLADGRGWNRLLIEADYQKYERLAPLADAATICVNGFVQPNGAQAIDQIMKTYEVSPTLMSIDVDGADYFIMEAMEARPLILIVEYNQTVPWFMDIRAKEPNNRFGASSLSLYRLATKMQYHLAGATETNLIFLYSPFGRGGPIRSPALLNINPSYEQIMTELPNRSGYIVTDYTCHRTDVNTDNLPKWGFRSNKPKDELVFEAEYYPGNSPAMSERAKRERHYYGS